MNGNETYANQMMQGGAQGIGNWIPQPAPKSIMQQIRDKAESLKANLAQVDTWKAELAQCERMLAAAEEPKDA